MLSHFQTLGLKFGASWAEIEEAHRQLIRRWHPDRFAADDPMRAEAEERAKRINEAFQRLSKLRIKPFRPVSHCRGGGLGVQAAHTVKIKTDLGECIVRNGVVYRRKRKLKGADQSLLDRKKIEKTLHSTRSEGVAFAKNIFSTTANMSQSAYNTLDHYLRHLPPQVPIDAAGEEEEEEFAFVQIENGRTFLRTVTDNRTGSFHTEDLARGWGECFNGISTPKK